MTEEQERAAFEAWVSDQGWKAEHLHLHRSVVDGRYAWELLNTAWQIWQARAALTQPANPAPEAPTDEQLISLAEKHHVWSKYGLEDAPKLLSFCRDVLALSQRNPASYDAPDEGRI